MRCLFCYQPLSKNEIDFHYANSLKDAKDIIKGDILVITLFRPFFNLELLYF